MNTASPATEAAPPSPPSVRLAPIAAANVRAEAARLQLEASDLAPYLEMSPGQARRKLRGAVAFTVDELGILAEVFRAKAAEVDQVQEAAIDGPWELLRTTRPHPLRAIA
jgi:hypothetical protein